jgi:GNAT superfamily N-acetyltransferase
LDIKLLANSDHAAAASILIQKNYSSLQKNCPFLPTKTSVDFQPRIEWVMREGQVFGVFEGDRLSSFFGAFTIENFRSEGLGALTPDWCLFTEPNTNGRRNLIALYKTMISTILQQGIKMHAISVYSHNQEIKEIFDLCAYGRIVMDAASSRDSLFEVLDKMIFNHSSLCIKNADVEDAKTLAALDTLLAEHISSIPVLMPRAHGSTAIEWENWLKEEDSVAFLAIYNGNPVGFIKAQNPQFDVTFSVHDARTLAINGLFLLPEARGLNIAQKLLNSIIVEAKNRDKSLISVDCETMNPEAYGFWNRYFTPLSWCLLRRY